MRKQTGIQVRHRQGCGSVNGRQCNCSPAYQAEVYIAKDDQKRRKTFATLKDAQRWRGQMLTEAAQGTLRGPRSTKLNDIAEAWEEAAKAGHSIARGKKKFKPRVITTHMRNYDLHWREQIGALKADQITRKLLQDIIY